MKKKFTDTWKPYEHSEKPLPIDADTLQFTIGRAIVMLQQAEELARNGKDTARYVGDLKTAIAVLADIHWRVVDDFIKGL
jgi:hypothetical protein